MKTCSKCTEYKDESEFYEDKRTESGLGSQCRSCCADNKRHLVDIRLKRAHRRLCEANASNGALEVACRKIFNRALRLKRASKPLRCEACSDVRPLRYMHADVKDPMKVKWFCASCENKTFL